MLSRNMLIAWHGPGGKEVVRVERVLWLAPDRGEAVTIVAQHLPPGGTALVDDTQAWPVHKPIADLEAALDGPRASVLDHDPYASLFMPEADLKARWGKSFDRRKTLRNAAHRHVAWLLEEGGVSLFDKAERGALIARRIADEAQEGRRLNATSLRAWLRNWWRRGMALNALYPLYDRSGGRNKRRKPGKRKRGAPHKGLVGTPRREGTNLTDDMRAKCRLGLDEAFLTTEGKTLEDAYQHTLERYFAIGRKVGAAGQDVPILAPRDRHPSKAQFKTVWGEYRKELGPEKVVKLREGEHAWNTRHRPSIHDTIRAATGPMALLQGDAYRVDTELASHFNRLWGIGSPILYLLIDVFSRMIVGLHIGLEGPNWKGMSLALVNVLEDKVAYGKAHGVPILPGDWPVQHWPEAIMFDRGPENLGLGSDQLADLDPVVKNLPPLRPDYKPYIESSFKLIKNKVLVKLPAMLKKREFGDADPREKAALTIHEIRTIIIDAIQVYNRSHVLTGYRLTPEMIADGVRPIPLDIWRWGIKNRSGTLRTKDPRIVYRALLPRGKARVDNEGIQYQGLSYECERAYAEGWFDDAKRPTYWDGTIAIDDRDTGSIYLMLGPDEFIPAMLMEKSDAYAGIGWPEALLTMGDQATLVRAATEEGRQPLAELHAHSEAIVKNALAETRRAVKGMRPKDRTEGKVEHRREARDDVRAGDVARVAGTPPRSARGVVVPIRPGATNQPPVPGDGAPSPRETPPPRADDATPAPISPFRRVQKRHFAKESQGEQE